MELTVYRQASKTRPDGTIVYKGEDAQPYVDGQLIMAADGLGGAAAIRHSSIDSRLFDEEQLPEALFTDVYDDYSDERLLNYVRKSFFELFAVKDCYTDNINNIKKSGYFASRIVTAIVLREFLYNEKISAESFFTALAKEASDEKREKAVKRLGEHFTEKIATELRQIAKNANIVYESSYSGLALLGTTLTAILYRELDDEVEALILSAGDSRPYMWSEEEGLCQLVRDEERPDGGMTNYIKANENAEFTINSRYMRFSSPCVIFAASDGCFDSGSFLSPLAFEVKLLEAAEASSSPEEMSEYLRDFFLEHGRHDDSSTIAMRFCGYVDFEAFRNSAKKRLEAIGESYTSQLAGLLEEDYIGETEKLRANAELQQQLFDSYNENYERYMGGDEA